MSAAFCSNQERTRACGVFRVRSERTSVSTSQGILEGFTAIHLPAARWKVEGSGALHVDVEPIARRLNLAEDDFLGGGIVLNDEMIPFAKFATLAHFLRDDDLASAGHSCGHKVSITYFGSWCQEN